MRKQKIITLAFGVACLSLIAWLLFSGEKEVDFNTQVKPIFNKKCISCHGGVKQQGGFSVLFRDEALAATKRGKPAIIPGDPEHSEFIRRIKSNDPEVRMPYKHAALSSSEIDILSTWIKQGAKWGIHWAYQPVKPVKVPDAGDDWAHNDLDKFIYAKLQKEGLKPSGQADRSTLLRRVSLDIIGTLPDDKTAQAYLTAADENAAYEKLVNHLLASKQFGEHWASNWLDVARYADTKGYEADGNRTIWQYRDWVIRAFNADMPYSDFITQQIAGDLLPNATDAQYIATAFSRNSPSNDEGGTSNEEFRVAAVLDRVNTVWSGLMSTTFACVQCHSHPYDPFKHDEYYQFMAYFNNTRDEDEPREYPVLRSYNDSLTVKLNQLISWVKKVSDDNAAQNIKYFLRTGSPSINSNTVDSLVNSVISNHNGDLIFRQNASVRIAGVNLQDAGQLIIRYATGDKGGRMQLRLDHPNGPVIASWSADTTRGFKNGMVTFARQNGVHDVYLCFQNPSLKDAMQNSVYLDWFYFSPQFPGAGKPGYTENKKLFMALAAANVPVTPVIIENPAAMHRTSNVFIRGAWTAKGKVVTPGVPKSLAFAMPAGQPQNRIGLAAWLTDKRNPLVSRTLVNRLWQQLYGAGIVETLEDMGSQGMEPTHKDLLDYMANQLMNNYNWSIKKMLHELVTMATYRQDSKLSAELKEKDLFNKFYARGPRVRLSFEQLRDQDLQIAGVLSPKMYGPPVMPWQPKGIWLSPYNDAVWVNATGDDQYRRAIYTYLKRTAPYPSAVAFDGAQRQGCTVRRINTNTPLQALVTLNDSVYTDLARHFAARMKFEGGTNIDKQIAAGYRIMLYKPIPPGRLQIFKGLYERSLHNFKADISKAMAYMGEKQKPVKPEDAALALVAQTLLNLDEVLTKN